MAEESASDIKPAVQPIQIHIKDGENAPIVFKVKRTIKFDRIIDTFLKKKGAAPGTYRFLWEGKRIDPEASPESLGLEDGDQIDALVEQTGGAGF